MLRADGQEYLEPRTLARRARFANQPPVRLDNPLDNAQPEPHALHARSIERLENPFLDLRGNARPGIRELKQNVIPRVGQSILHALFVVEQPALYLHKAAI